MFYKFVTLNASVLPPIFSPIDQSKSYATVVATKQDVSLFEHVIQGKVPFTPVRNGVR